MARTIVPASRVSGSTSPRAQSLVTRTGVAIPDPSRRRVLDLLVRSGEASASWLAGQVPFSRQAVSKHLAVFEEARLISRRKQGREVL